MQNHLSGVFGGLVLNQLGQKDSLSLFSNATSKVDIDDISLTSNLYFKSLAREDLLINFLVSLFTPYKNFTSVRFNLGRMCLKQISSHFTTTSHKESLSPIVVESFFCKTCVFIAL